MDKEHALASLRCKAGDELFWPNRERFEEWVEPVRRFAVTVDAVVEFVKDAIADRPASMPEKEN